MANPLDNAPVKAANNPLNTTVASPISAATVAKIKAIPDAPMDTLPAKSSSFDLLKGVRTVLQDFVQGASSAVKATQAAAPAVSTLKDFFTPNTAYGPSIVPGQSETGGEHALDLGAQALGSTLRDTATKLKSAYTVLTSQASPAQKANAVGEGALGIVNTAFAPISTLLATASALPGIGHVADGINDIFAGISGGASNVAAQALDRAAKEGYLSPETAKAITPLVSDTASLVAQILAGKAGEEAGVKVLNKTQDITTRIADHLENNPIPSPAGFIRNPFHEEPASPEAKGSVGELAVERDPTKVAQTLRDMGVQGDIADAFAPKIAAETDPTKVTQLLQTVKGTQNLADGGHIETTPMPLAESVADRPAIVSDSHAPPTEKSPVVLRDTVQGERVGKVFDATKPLESGEYDALNKVYRGVQESLGIDEHLLEDLPKSLTGDQALSKLIEGSGASGPQQYDLMEEVAQALRNVGYSDVARTTAFNRAEAPQLNINGRDVPKPVHYQDVLKTYMRDMRMTPVSELLNKRDLPPRPGPNDRISTPGDFITELPKPEQEGLRAVVRDAVKGPGKVHLLDYLATPEYVLEKIGLGKEARALRTGFEKYLDQRSIELAKLQAWKDRAKGIPGNEATIFDYLDGQERETKPLMTDVEYELAREIRPYLKEWAKRLKLPEDKQISHYITHIFERGASTEAEGAQIFEDPELAALMQQQVAGSVYDPFLQKRLGSQNYKHDVWAALDAYIKRATRKEAMDPALEGLKEASGKLDEQSYNYVMKLSHRINMRPTEFEKLIDNLIKASFVGHRYGDRPIAYLSTKVRSLFYRGTLGLNFGSAVRNLTQGVNTYAKLGERYTVVGYSKLVYRLMSRNLDELYENHVLEEQFIQDQKVGVYKTALQKLDPVLFSLFEQAEKINRGAAYFGSKSKAINEGKSEADAIEYAKRMVRETQFSFGSIDTPVALNDDAVKTLTQMQTYSIKQIEFLVRMAKNREFGGMIRYALGSYVALHTIGQVFGMTLGQLMPTVGIGGSPVSSLVSNIWNTQFASNDQEKAAAVKALKTQAWTLIPAGAQIHKTLAGLKAYYAGKDVTATGRTRFNIPQNTSTLLQAALFGKSALPQAQEYYANLGKKKSTSNPL